MSYAKKFGIILQYALIFESALQQDGFFFFFFFCCGREREGKNKKLINKEYLNKIVKK